MHTFRQLRPEALTGSEHTDPLLFDRVVNSPLSAVGVAGEDEVDLGINTGGDHVNKLRMVGQENVVSGGGGELSQPRDVRDDPTLQIMLGRPLFDRVREMAEAGTLAGQKHFQGGLTDELRELRILAKRDHFLDSVRKYPPYTKGRYVREQ